MDNLPPYVFLPLFAGFWCAIEAVLSLLGGWHRLAKRYPDQPFPSGDLFRFSSASMGFGLPVNYGSCLFVRVSERGVRLSTLFLFRFMHPPMFIPWSEFTSCQKGWFGFWPGVELRFQDPGLRIVFRGWTGKAILKQWQQLHTAQQQIV